MFLFGEMPKNQQEVLGAVKCLINLAATLFLPYVIFEQVNP